VRLYGIRDYVRLLRARYIDELFKIAVLVVVLATLRVVWPSGPNSVRMADLTEKLVTDLTREHWGLAVGAVLLLATYVLRRPSTVYLLDFSLFNPPAEWRVTHTEIEQLLQSSGKTDSKFSEEDLDFMRRLLEKSGTGQSTAWPPGLVRCLKDREGIEQDQSMQATRDEAEAVICTCLQTLFESSGVAPREVDFLVINCSLFSPTPSLCAMAANKFKMRSDMRTYNLSGQGCSASLISVDLASELLRNNPNSVAVVVSTELITQSLYHGHERSFLVQNTLFRCGGAAVMLTNRPRLVLRAKYQLKHLVRTQCSDDVSYGCVFECQDKTGMTGVCLSKDIVKVAGDAMKRNLTQLGPLVLPLSEQVKVAWGLFLSLVSKEKRARYVPNFKTAFNFFCIHAGGRGVLDGIEKNLRLEPADLMPSRATLHDRGNTSSSSIWYELDYIERNMPIKRGHQILQLAFGSGFKCNSAVWTRLRSSPG